MPRSDPAAAAALALLDEAYEALLKGDFAALGPISARLEEELLRLPPGLAAEELRRIRTLADRNAVVLLAAQRGVRAARRRFEEIRSASSGLVTYDRSGKRAEVNEPRSLAQRL